MLPEKHRHIGSLLNLAVFVALYPNTLWANPAGGEIIHGQARIDTSVAGITTITNTPNAIIQWQNFNIAEHEITRFIQQNSQSAVLNRIIGGDPSAILGQLISNGKVLLINPDGFVFGRHSTVDTQSMIASSLNLSNKDFLTGNYHFLAGSQQTGTIRNEGIIRAGKDGNIVLIAPSIQNNGVIKSEGGQVTLAAGQELIVTSLDNPGIRYQVKAPDDKVLNLGKLLSEGGAINVFAGSISHSGAISADSVTVDKQGRVTLVAEHAIHLAATSKASADNNNGDAGTVHIESEQGAVIAAGSLSARADRKGQGGAIAVLGKHVGIVDTAQADAGGTDGGGQILIGGDSHGNNPAIANAEATYLGKNAQLKADAENRGDGGKIVVWANDTARAHGRISAQGGRLSGNGGSIETSAPHLDTAAIQVNASAAKGRSGQWLLDPNDVTIDNQETDVQVSGNPDFRTENDNAVVAKQSIETALNNGTSVSITTGTQGANNQQGDITVATAITKSAGGAAALRLTARNDIQINAPITAENGKLNIELRANSDGVNGGSTRIGKTLDLNFGTLTLHGKTLLPATSSLKNADLSITHSSSALLDGRLNAIGAVTIADHARLAVNRNSIFKQLSLNGGLLTGTGAITVIDNFNFAYGKLAGSGRLFTTAEATTQLVSSGTGYLDKNWTNLGAVYWLGNGDLEQQTSTPVVFINEASGTLNINEPRGESLGAGSETVRHLPTTIFSNRGTVNIAGGTVKILAGGNDTGDYQITGTGALLFMNNSKIFNGADITSNNLVTFGNGDYRFSNGAAYHAPETKVDNAILTFGTGNAIVLPKLTLDHATLNGSDAIEISDHFNFYAGTLTGGNIFTTQQGATTSLAVKDSVFINKRWNNYGKIDWNGEAAIGVSNAGLFNGDTGIIHIAGTGIDNMLGITTRRFDNLGTVTVTDATLQVFGTGTDSGGYHAGKTGRLQFIDGSRNFLAAATLTSSNPVAFIGGKNFFHNHSRFQAPDTIIDNATVAFNTGADLSFDSLTLTNTARLMGSDPIDIRNHFDFYSGIATGPGKLLTRAESSTTLFDQTALVNKTWDNYGAVSFTAPSAANLKPPSLSGISLSLRQWNNFGAINWAGPVAPANPLGQLVVLNNKSSGTFNINNKQEQGFRELNVAAFNNQGTTNLLSGELKISAPGADTGSYRITDTGRLQFASGTRLFADGSKIDSTAPVIFLGGSYHFNPGSSYTAPNTSIDGATVNFSANTRLINLDLSAGSLHAARKLTVNGIFNWTGGVLTGADSLNFTRRFNYSDGLMTATGALNIDDHGARLVLPAMPAIARVVARTSGDLQLTGDIVAKSDGTAIQLAAGNSFDNKASAKLATENGRWLIYAAAPATTRLGGLANDFKHYGCEFATACNDGFTLSDASGNGLLYRLQPVLTVTPEATRSIYGTSVNFSSSYSGFIDGDTPKTAAITGTAKYRVGGPLSDSVRYRAGHHDVAYLNGLGSGLGYLFKNDTESLNEWLITPRTLLINANPTEKLAGDNDPPLSFHASGLLSGDNVSGSLVRLPGEAVGKYPIRQGSLSAGGDYAIKYNGADFIIQPANSDQVENDSVEIAISNQQNSLLALFQSRQFIEQDDRLKKWLKSDFDKTDENAKNRKLQQCR